jgi:hypothetical protein
MLATRTFSYNFPFATTVLLLQNACKPLVMKYAEFEVKPPIVFVKINPIDVSLEDYKNEVLQAQTKILYELPSSAWIFDSRHTKLLSSEHRIAAGNWMKSNSQTIKQRVKAVFLVECSFWTELMLKSIFLVINPPVPFHILKKADDAYKMLAQKYQMVIEPSASGQP